MNNNNFLEPPDNINMDVQSSIIPNIHDSLQNSVIIQQTPIKYAHKNTNESFIKPQLQQIDYYKVKNWCDAQDEYGVWRLGRIKSAKDTLRSIEFDGWGTKYQRQYCIHSDKIKPLRYHTLGYTGQKKVTLRDYELNIEELKSATIQLKYLMKQEGLKGFYPYELTRFLRCDLFYLIDTCLTLPYEVESLDTIKVIKQFFFAFLEFSKKWLKILPSVFRNSQGCFQLDPESQYKNHDVALLKSGFEICLLLKGLFGFDDRCLKLYQNHIDEIYCQEFIQDFIIDNGIYSVADVLAYTDNTQQKGPSRRIQLEIIWPLLRSIMLIFRQMSPQGYMRQLKSFAKNTISYLEDLFEDQQYADLFKQSEDHSKFLRDLQKLFKTIIKDEKFPQFLNFENQFSKQQTIQRDSIFFQPPTKEKYRTISSLSMVCNENAEHDDNPFYQKQKSRMQSRYYDDENKKYLNELYDQVQQNKQLHNQQNEQEINQVLEFYQDQSAKPKPIIQYQDETLNEQITNNNRIYQDDSGTNNMKGSIFQEASQDLHQNHSFIGEQNLENTQRFQEGTQEIHNYKEIQYQNRIEGQNQNHIHQQQVDQVQQNEKNELKQTKQMNLRKDFYPKITINIEEPNNQENNNCNFLNENNDIREQSNKQIDLVQENIDQENLTQQNQQNFIRRSNQFKFNGENEQKVNQKPILQAQQFEQRNLVLVNQKTNNNETYFADSQANFQQQILQKKIVSPYQKTKVQQEETFTYQENEFLTEVNTFKKEEQKDQILSAERMISGNKWQSQLSDGIENKLEFMASELQLLKNLVLQLSDSKNSSQQKSFENQKTQQVTDGQQQDIQSGNNHEIKEYNKLQSNQNIDDSKINSINKDTQNNQNPNLSNKISTPLQQADFMKNQVVNPFNPSISNNQYEQTQKNLNQNTNKEINESQNQITNEVKNEISKEYQKILESDYKKQLSEEIKSYLKQQQADQLYFPQKSDKKQERHSFTCGVKDFESDNQQKKIDLSFQKMLDKICIDGDSNILNQCEIIIKEAWNNQVLLKEFELLCQIEFYLKESNILDSLKLIRWRKKLIQLQDLIGYEVTNLLLEKTKHKKGSPICECELSQKKQTFFEKLYFEKRLN